MTADAFLYWPGWLALVAALVLVLAAWTALAGYVIDRIVWEDER